MTEKYEFIDAEYAGTAAADAASAPTLTQMCAWLGISRSGFYDWRSRPESATAQRRNELRLLIVRAFEGSDGTYGYRRVAAQLARWGIRAGLELVRALMRELGLSRASRGPGGRRQRGRARPGRSQTWSHAISALIFRAQRWWVILPIYRHGKDGCILRRLSTARRARSSAGQWMIITGSR